MQALTRSGIEVHRHDGVERAAYVKPEHRAALLDSPEHRTKRIYVQNLASMLPVRVLAPEPGERILDLTAAPGSKTLQIAALAGPSSEVVAVELVRSRFHRMRANLEEAGAAFVRTIMKDGRGVWRHRPEYFDRVLLDAPCSSEGRFRDGDPDSIAYWQPRKGKEMMRKQKALLSAALRCAGVGGRVVYSTCSLSVRENEAVVAWALEKFIGAVEAEPVKLNFEEAVSPVSEWKGKELSEGVANAVRLVPSERMEGFFVASFRKIASTES